MKEYKPAPHHLPPGTILAGKYIVGAVLGEGGFGITYIGRDINLDIRVAIKEYFPSGVVNRSNTCSSEITAHVGDAQAFFEKGKSSFLSEARTLARFADEASIVSVRDFFSENKTAYIVMEYLEGTDLKDCIKQHGRLSFEQAAAMLMPVMRALSKIHAQGLIHRDISPGNIMILNNGTVKLLDFGAAREVGGADEKSLSILLKPGYAPEEQYRTKGHQGPWTDVYALSATMYKMMTGLTPVDAMNRIFSDDLRRPSELNPDITAGQEAVILRGMAVQQGDRYQTIDELCAACQAALAQEENADAGGAAADCRRTESRGGHRKRTRRPPEKPADHPANGEKKPNAAAFAGSIITGLLCLFFILGTAAQILEEKNVVFPVVMTLVMGAAAFLLGRLYFPRMDNRNRRPNVYCLAGGILTGLLTVFCAWLTYKNFTDTMAERGAGAFCAVLTALSLALPVFFGYFYFPRLDKKGKKRAARICGGIAAGAAAAFVIAIVFASLNTVTIGDQNFKRDTRSVYITADLLTTRDIEKLKELKNLGSLSLHTGLLDDEDIRILGELSQLNQLSISANNDVTDISPLGNLKQLTSLDVSNTSVSDISCLGGLTRLKKLYISGTGVSDLSVLAKLTELETLKMDSLKELDASTIILPETVEELHCGKNGLTSLDFVSGSKSLRYIYASGNQISDLTPLSKFELSGIELAANQISDLSVLNLSAIRDLDVSNNDISDISCLKGTPVFDIDLGYNRITDIGALADNDRIGIVRLNNNQITDISPLKDCFRISFLDISFNQVADISAVATIDEMEQFLARGNQISDLSPLAACAKLIEGGHALDLRDNRIVSVEALSGYTKTKNLYLSGNQIADISPLHSFTALEMLKLNNNQITDASPLADLPELYILELVNNPVTGLGSFRLAGYHNSTVTHSATLRLSYNENIDFPGLAEAEHLNVCVYNVPPRQQDTLEKYGFKVYQEAEDLDEVEANDDLAENETPGEQTNG